VAGRNFSPTEKPRRPDQSRKCCRVAFILTGVRPLPSDLSLFCWLRALAGLTLRLAASLTDFNASAVATLTPSPFDYARLGFRYKSHRRCFLVTFSRPRRGRHLVALHPFSKPPHAIASHPRPSAQKSGKHLSCSAPLVNIFDSVTGRWDQRD
jgi:hypothetical protein